MNYTAIDIQGNVLSSEILEKIRTEDIRYQKSQDFGLSPNIPVRDEISLAWNLAVSNWSAFKLKRESLSDTDSGTSETRKYWLQPLMNILGYELQIGNAEIINGKSYAISHRAQNIESFPVHLIGINQSLDRRPDSGGTRLSAHALIQEYTNNTDHMYGLVSNGRFLRLLRDATRLSRLSYLEFDLEQMMEEGLYVEFALLYRTLHASRMPQNIESAGDCFLEFYHQEALASGSRIRERLSAAVENSIKELANGILNYSANQNLRDDVLSGKISAKDYYLYTLRLVYRMLFLLVIEERKLIYPDKRDDQLNKKRSIYYDFYSIQRLTKLSVKMVYVDPRKSDLWQSLLTTFALFEEGKYGQKLGIEPLGSGLFSPSALGALSQQLLDNESLLKVLRYLVTFENERGQRVRVNYADLDVEEFGSVYEGLLEYDPVITDNIGQPVFGFVHGNARSSSGSHYTPEELVKPLITYSLDYLISDKLKESDPEKGLLSLSICDVACGSGHILLSAARRVGFELAKVRSHEDQPTPSVLRLAIRDVIRHCIYGVDLNPLAIELCKVALWLEAHEPGQPMNFLDHHIKCGNAIVGLAHVEELERGIASEAFKSLPKDQKEIAASFKKRNDLERKTINQLNLTYQKDIDDNLNEVQKNFASFTSLPENTPEQIASKDQAYKEIISGSKWWRLKQLTDLQVAQFFIPKTTSTKESLTTDAQYRKYLGQGMQIIDRGMSSAISAEKNFFHWFLEFPEVFKKGGFDCILGNPPFLGGQKLTGTFGNSYLEFLKYEYAPAGAVDLVTYFFRRTYDLIKPNGFISLISTNTIAQGGAREGGLDVIVANGASINHAIRSMKWPGVAAVEVALVTVYKGVWDKKFYLGNKEVINITPYLDDSEVLGNPFPLKQNAGKSFQGSIVLGKGFVLTPEEAEALITKDSRNKEVLFPYLNGEDLNNDPEQKPSRWVINFFDWNEEKARTYPECFEIVERLVKPERMNQNDKGGKEKWWQFLRPRNELYGTISKLDQVITLNRYTKYLILDLQPNNVVFSDSIVVFALNSYNDFGILSSVVHDIWAWKHSSTMGSSTLRYSASSAFETFPFPENSPNDVGTICEILDKFRKYLMTKEQIGLTNLYNRFHDNKLNASNDKYLSIKKLRELHSELDESVLISYGWTDIELKHGFYEIEGLPETDKTRFTIHPDARKEILSRILVRNLYLFEKTESSSIISKNKVISSTKISKRTNNDPTLF